MITRGKVPVYQFFVAIFILAAGVSSCKSKRILTDASSHRNKKATRGSLEERYAEVMDVKARDIRNQKLYKFIDSWMGVPHVDGGMNKKGIDCSGFVILLEKEIFDRTLPRVARDMATSVKRKYEEELQEGDLVFFDFNGRRFSHVGVYLQNNKFVHVSTTKGVVLSSLKDSWYYKYFSRGGSIR